MNREHEKLLPGFEEYVDTLPTREKEPPKGYIRVSPSSLETSSSLSGENITEAEVKGSILGYIGHALDNRIVGEIRQARETGDTKVLTTLERDSQEWLKDWKAQHHFFKRAGRSKKTALTEGSVFSAHTIEKIWNNTEKFEQSVIDAHMKRVTHRPSLMETDPNLKLYVEEPAMYNIDLGFAKFQVNMRYDYLMYDSKNDKVVIVDTKFGSQFGYHEDLESQAFLYCVLARYHLQNRDKFGKMNIRNLHVDTRNVEFWYRALDRVRGEFHYFPTEISSGVSVARTEAFFEKLATYAENYQDIKESKKRQTNQFVMPYIPVKEEIEIKQPRLIYLSG